MNMKHSKTTGYQLKYDDVFKPLAEIRDREKAEQEEFVKQKVLKLCKEGNIRFEEFPKEEYEKRLAAYRKAQQKVNELIYHEDLHPLLRIVQEINGYDDHEMDDLRNSHYELNHTKITAFLFEHLRNYGTFPLPGQIAEVTGLSRQTVYKHLESIKKESYSKRYREGIELMRRTILGQLAGKYLREGDLKAAALYLRFTEEKNVNIQLNNITLNKQTINNLTPHQVREIETIIMGEEEE